MRYLLTIIFILTCFLAKSQPSPGMDNVKKSTKLNLTARLGIPFGTIGKLEAEIYDGYNLHQKFYEGTYLLKIKSINGKPIKGTLLLPFIDRTGTLPSEDRKLSELIYNKEDSELSQDQINKMVKEYTGKKVILMAYETGEFIGVPENYFNYRPIGQELMGLIFFHSLVVVANLKK